MHRPRTLVAIGLLATTLAVAGCSTSDPDGNGATVVNPSAATTTGAERGGDGGAKPGTRENPVPAGTTVKIGDWQVSLGPTVQNATDQVRGENQFNEPPAAGRQFVMVPVTLVYKGSKSGTPLVDLSIKFLGSGGNTFGSGGSQDDYCGVIPNPIDNLSEMFPDATASGNECASVPSDQVASGLWIVEQSFALNDDRTFYALA
ncbi:hypothetical protein [Pseudofrankia sp. BMG5.37]|uniref:hypothetical protein n=1 Tax=Pseudofrankia sp. BMG5.37 TaxID=3050035 RepID=UPI00289612A2|nr:hypothetical protein [Pseudofrankia sp. BMG5.37]MDT3438321.1 hypothetical protein [Pseudofrankia sp. BMG5.37]